MCVLITWSAREGADFFLAEVLNGYYQVEGAILRKQLAILCTFQIIGASASFEVAPERSNIVCCICLIATTVELGSISGLGSL